MKFSLIHLRLLFQSPKDYLFQLIHPDQSIIHHSPYNPKVETIVKSLEQDIRSLNCDLEFNLIGSTGLQISGSGDIDIILSSHSSDLSKIVEELKTVFGFPVIQHAHLAQWKFNRDGHDVELDLMSQHSVRFKQQIKIFNILKNSPQYLEEYQQIKDKFQAKLAMEYNFARMDFFNRLQRL